MKGIYPLDVRDAKVFVFALEKPDDVFACYLQAVVSGPFLENAACSNISYSQLNFILKDC